MSIIKVGSPTSLKFRGAKGRRRQRLRRPKEVRNLELVWYFLAGSFYFNGLPHLIKGITGQTHMTPFKRVSSAPLNVIWAFVNLALALFLLGLASGKGGVVLPWNANIGGPTAIAFLLGGFVIAIYLAYFWSNPNARLPWHKD